MDKEISKQRATQLLELRFLQILFKKSYLFTSRKEQIDKFINTIGGKDRNYCEGCIFIDVKTFCPTQEIISNYSVPELWKLIDYSWDHKHICNQYLLWIQSKFNQLKDNTNNT